MLITKRFGVIGNPIEHSLSPTIHQQFAKQFLETIDYQKYLIENDQLTAFIQDFFKQDGYGLNVTLPFKELVIKQVDLLTDNARLAGSVNTLTLNSQGLLVGDTTDGLGLLLDLKHRQFDIKNKNILVIGAGGASQSILVSLLQAGAIVQLHNRSQNKIDNLIKRFVNIGEISAFENHRVFDGVISAVSVFDSNLMNPVKNCIDKKTFCYDLNYSERAQSFYHFAMDAGCTAFADGVGMLIGQAAHSYQIWTGKLPDISHIKLFE